MELFQLSALQDPFPGLFSQLVRVLVDFALQLDRVRVLGLGLEELVQDGLGQLGCWGLRYGVIAGWGFGLAGAHSHVHVLELVLEVLFQELHFGFEVLVALTGHYYLLVDFFEVLHHLEDLLVFFFYFVL